MTKAYKIPSIADSLRADVLTGDCTLEAAAAELYRAHLLIDVDPQAAAELLHINKN